MQTETHVQATPEVKTSARERVRIFDTTLRDGEQAPGFSMNRAQKLRIAHALDALGVDVMEAGFPQASPDDFASVAAIAEAIRGPSICALARCREGDIDTSARALEKARAPRLHLFLSTSPLHREYKLRMSKAQVVDTAIEAVRRARALCDDVEFSAEDGLRTEPEFLLEVFDAAFEAGARTLNVPDTVGYTTPAEINALFTYLCKNVRNADEAIFSAHCHDDLGMAVANSLAAVAGGARQVEGALNGIGERAGNAALEEVVMALKVRGEYFGVDCGVNPKHIYPASHLLAQVTGQAIPRNKAVVGRNAFAHESGIHQHGMLKHRGTYEIMQPEDVGASQSQLVLGKHSGRAALRKRLTALGYTPSDAEMEDISARFKQLADRKREVFDSDLEALALGRDPDAAGPWHIVQLNAASHLGGSASASVNLAHEDGRTVAEAAIGDGPVDAVLHAVERATGEHLQLVDFRVQAISEGGDAQGQAILDVRHAERDWRGRGYSTDIVEAAALAALDVANRIVRAGTSASHPVKETA